jgi:hypothetical protein
VVRSLQYGVGDEGRLKDALVRVIAHDATADRSVAAVRGYEAAAARAADSAVLSRDLGLKKGPAPKPDQGLSFPKGSKVTVWVGKDKYVGTVKDDRGDWLVIQTDSAEVTLRKSEITRSEVSGKPAAGGGK